MTQDDDDIPLKVDCWELRRYFNEPDFNADLVKRTKTRVETYCELAPAKANQEPGTMSLIHEWYGEGASGNRTLLATIHWYRTPDGSIGASGRIDPQFLLVDGIPYIDP